MTGFAPYDSVTVQGVRDHKGYRVFLPASPVPRCRVRRVDRYFVPDGSGAFVLVPEGADIPVVSRSKADGCTVAPEPCPRTGGVSDTDGG
ncbi:MAG: hypothetical protein ABEH78_02225 [Haloferacaceae archaeon]